MSTIPVGMLCDGLMITTAVSWLANQATKKWLAALCAIPVKHPILKTKQLYYVVWGQVNFDTCCKTSAANDVHAKWMLALVPHHCKLLHKMYQLLLKSHYLLLNNISIQCAQKMFSLNILLCKIVEENIYMQSSNFWCRYSVRATIETVSL